MTKQERDDRNRVDASLIALGFSQDECNKLRRISNTLRRWYELECGTENDHGTSFAIECGHFDAGKFVSDPDGSPFLRRAWVDAKGEYQVTHEATRDNETAATKRLDKIIYDHNKDPKINAPHNIMVSYYLQTDPRGAALYIIPLTRYREYCKQTNRKADGQFDAIYTSVGICVY